MDDAKTFKTDGIHEEDPKIQDRTVFAAFSDAATAEQASDALKAAGYKDVDVTTAQVDDQGKPVEAHGFWHKVKDWFGGHKDAPLYGEVIRAGNSLVTVHTEQGRAAYAIDVLDGFGPIEIKGGDQAWIGEDTAVDRRRDALESDIVPTPDTSIAGLQDSVIEEELILVEVDPDLGNDRVRSYSRNLPVVVADQDRGVAGVVPDVAPDAVKRAD